MTEDMIERRVEAKFNGLDSLLISGKLTQSEYDMRARAIDRWADLEYARLHARPDLYLAAAIEGPHELAREKAHTE